MSSSFLIYCSANKRKFDFEQHLHVFSEKKFCFLIFERNELQTNAHSICAHEIWCERKRRILICLAIWFVSVWLCVLMPFEVYQCSMYGHELTHTMSASTLRFDSKRVHSLIKTWIFPSYLVQGCGWPFHRFV